MILGIKLLLLLLNENINSIDHIKIIKNKVTKNIGLRDWVKNRFDSKCLKSLYYLYNYCILIYRSMASVNTIKTEKKIIVA